MVLMIKPITRRDFPHMAEFIGNRVKI